PTWTRTAKTVPTRSGYCQQTTLADCSAPRTDNPASGMGGRSGSVHQDVPKSCSGESLDVCARSLCRTTVLSLDRQPSCQGPAEACDESLTEHADRLLPRVAEGAFGEVLAQEREVVTVRVDRHLPLCLPSQGLVRRPEAVGPVLPVRAEER